MVNLQGLILPLYAAIASVQSQETFTLADNFIVNIKDGSMDFNLPNSGNNAVLKGKLGVSLGQQVSSAHLIEEDGQKLLHFGSDLKLSVERANDHCIHIRWLTNRNMTLVDCLDLSDDVWFGGPQSVRQYWPFNNMSIKDDSYVTKQKYNQAMATPYWITSSGFYVFVNKTTPLFIDANHRYNKSLCFIAKQAPPYLPRGGTSLKYKICAHDNVRDAHLAAVQNDLGHPTDIPDRRMVQHPIWSTWVRCKFNVNDTAVREFAQDIVRYKFNNSQLEIDDNWETCYGSVEFNRSRFHDMAKLGDDLHAMGFRITLWNHPFINTDCHLFEHAKKKGFLVKDQTGNVVTEWWDGDAGVVDFTNPEAAQWFLDRHFQMMKENNIDGVKMDAGESGWLPEIPQLHVNVTDQPDGFTSSYVRTVAKFGKLTEVRVGHNTQDVPVFVRMIDRDSKWGFDNGLATLITTMYQLSISGYPFVLPDMVGGNAYARDVVTKELFIRWLQANTFMPSIQFSVAPWDFDEETIEISRKFTSLHYEYSDEILRVMEECVRTGKPVNMPLWWVAPTDPVALDIWSEYMLGEDLLVAPVLTQGAVSRDIYLPQGLWQDEASPDKTRHLGPLWLYNYSAPLDTLPFFTRVTPSVSVLTV